MNILTRLSYSHNLTVTATLNDVESTTMMLIVYNQNPVSGLTVSNIDSDDNVWVFVTTEASLQAQVAEGTELTAEWLFGDTDLVYQVSLCFSSM